MDKVLDNLEIRIDKKKEILGPYDAHIPNCGMLAGDSIENFIIQYIDEQGKLRIAYSNEVEDELNQFNYLKQKYAKY